MEIWKKIKIKIKNKKPKQSTLKGEKLKFSWAIINKTISNFLPLQCLRLPYLFMAKKCFKWTQKIEPNNQEKRIWAKEWRNNCAFDVLFCDQILFRVHQSAGLFLSLVLAWALCQRRGRIWKRCKAICDRHRGYQHMSLQRAPSKSRRHQVSRRFMSSGESHLRRIHLENWILRPLWEWWIMAKSFI